MSMITFVIQPAAHLSQHSVEHALQLACLASPSLPALKRLLLGILILRPIGHEVRQALLLPVVQTWAYAVSSQQAVGRQVCAMLSAW